MSIQTDLTRIKNAKAAIKAAIEGKGVTVPDATLLDGMASLIESIEAGGGSGLEIANYYVFGGSFTPAEDVSDYLELATDESLGLPSGYIYQKRNFLFGAIWSIGGFLNDANYINAAMSAPMASIDSPSLTNSLTGAVLKRLNTVSRSMIMFNGGYPRKVYLSCDASYMLKAGVEYAWAAFIPKG